jgi:hypothetical protein
MLQLGILALVSGLAAIVVGVAWNLRIYFRERHSGQRALQLQAMGAGVSFIGVALMIASSVSVAGPTAAVVAAAVALTGLIFIGLSTRIQIRP